MSRKGIIGEKRSKLTFRGLVGIYYLVKNLYRILRREKTGKIIEMIDIWRNANTYQSAKYTVGVWKKSLERKLAVLVYHTEILGLLYHGQGRPQGGIQVDEVALVSVGQL